MEKTIKKYYENVYESEFIAKVVSCVEDEGKKHIALDGTLFYPGGGGQPCDVGKLMGLDVLKCYETIGTIWHVVEDPNSCIKEGDEIEGQIDFERRFRLMQNHTGEHLLSGLVKTEYGATNIGFHMSERGFTIDLGIPLPEDAIEHLEKLANEAVLEGVNVVSKVYKGDDIRLGAIDYRAKRSFSAKDDVRIVYVTGYDLCACAALHVENTLQVRLVKILSAVKYKGGMRLTVVCGEDALWDYDAKHRNVKEISRVLSAEQHNVAAAVKAYKSMHEETRKKHDAVRRDMLEVKAGNVPEGSGLVWFFEDGLDNKGMLKFAQSVAKQAKVAVVISDSRFCICAKTGELEELQRFVAKFCEALQGKGHMQGMTAQGAFEVSKSKAEKFLKGYAWGKERLEHRGIVEIGV